GDGQVNFEEFMTLLGPKLTAADNPDGFLSSEFDTIFWKFNVQQMTLEELKQVIFSAFREQVTMKDIETIIMNEEGSNMENSENYCAQVEGFYPGRRNRQTCVRKSLICAFAVAFIISVMLIAANQILRSGMQ
uniref:EF-hand domain-containing protein n=1 Tax=Petromyzon marinus TaxID=7757 RepID=S4RM31_PETMA